MSVDERPPEAHPIFRKLAIGMALVCFILAGVFGAVADREIRFPVAVVCLIVGVVMAVIGQTGSWPPRRSS